jgi:hypothetical protein
MERPDEEQLTFDINSLSPEALFVASGAVAIMLVAFAVGVRLGMQIAQSALN